MQRIATFREALIAVDRVGENEKQIEFAEASQDKIVLEKLEVATPTGCAELDQPQVEIGRGERVERFINDDTMRFVQ
jgi:putative ATP-binding cassette transporter